MRPDAGATLPSPFDVSPKEVAANRRRAAFLGWSAAALPGLVLGVALGLGVGPIAGVVGGAVLLVAAWAVLWRGATGIVLRLLGARPAQSDCARLVNVVEGLCATFGLRGPRLMLVADPVPNACAVGRDPDRAAVVVTTGLLSTLGLIELEGVLAHELAHVKRDDVAVAGVAVVAVAPLAWLTGRDGLLHAALGRGRELRADEVGVAAVRYPPGLHDALSSMSAGPAPDPGSVFSGRRAAMTRWLWVDPMVGRRGAAVNASVDATTVRVSALAEW